MISHALVVLRNELERHLKGFDENAAHCALGSPADVSSQQGGTGKLREKVLLTVVNISEERAHRNLPNRTRDPERLTARYENPPICLNLALLVSATHSEYSDALLGLSRAIAFFQAVPEFAPDTISPQSLQEGQPVNPLDRLEDFRLVLNLWSPTMEEVNDMWGMLGGKQFPFALYSMRMLELRLPVAPREDPLISEVLGTFSHEVAVT